MTDRTPLPSQKDRVRYLRWLGRLMELKTLCYDCEQAATAQRRNAIRQRIRDVTAAIDRLEPPERFGSWEDLSRAIRAWNLVPPVASQNRMEARE